MMQQSGIDFEITSKTNNPHNDENNNYHERKVAEIYYEESCKQLRAV